MEIKGHFGIGMTFFRQDEYKVIKFESAIDGSTSITLQTVRTRMFPISKIVCTNLYMFWDIIQLPVQFEEAHH